MEQHCRIGTAVTECRNAGGLERRWNLHHQQQDAGRYDGDDTVATPTADDGDDTVTTPTADDGDETVPAPTADPTPRVCRCCQWCATSCACCAAYVRSRETSTVLCNRLHAQVW